MCVRREALLAALLGVLLAVCVTAPTAAARTLTAPVAAVAAAAAPCVYVPQCVPTLSVTSPLAAAGSVQTVVGSGFLPGDTVTVTVTLADGSTVVLSAVADANGEFTVSFTVPGELGAAGLTAVGARSGSASTVMTVVAGGISGSGAPTGTTGAGAAGGGAAGGGGTGSGGGRSPDSGGLAFTGVAVVGTGALALVLLVAGGTLLLLGRRRPLPGRHTPRRA